MNAFYELEISVIKSYVLLTISKIVRHRHRSKCTYGIMNMYGYHIHFTEFLGITFNNSSSISLPHIFYRLWCVDFEITPPETASLKTKPKMKLHKREKQYKWTASILATGLLNQMTSWRHIMALYVQKRLLFLPKRSPNLSNVEIERQLSIIMM